MDKVSIGTCTHVPGESPSILRVCNSAAYYDVGLASNVFSLIVAWEASRCSDGVQLMNMAEGMMGGGNNKPQGQGGYQGEGQQGNCHSPICERIYSAQI